MNRKFYAVPAAFCLAATVVAAQAPAGEKPADNRPAAPAPTAQQPTRPAEPSAMAANKVTYTGCVKAGTAADTWVLENAQVAAKAGAPESSTVGTAGTPGMAFNLDPAATVNVKAHANHKVEIVGTLAPAASGAGAPSATAGAAGSTAPRQQFKVESLKMVSATCP